MRVCMITGTLPYIKCGVGDYTHILCNKLNKNKEVELSVITTKGLSKGKEYKTYDIIENWDNKDIRKIINKINEIKPQIVHIQYPTIAYKKNTMINILPYFLRNKYKVVTTIHEYSDNSTLGKLRIWPNILFSDAIVVVDKQYMNDIKKFKFLRKKKFYYINIGSNIPKSNITYEERNEIRSAILNGNCSRILGYFGFVNKLKGIETILYSMSNLKKGNRLYTIFMIIGELNDSNEYHKSIIDLVNRLELSKYVHITGYLNEQEVGKFINAADYIVLPFVNGLSTKNGSFLASMQEGKYIITTKRNGEKAFEKDRIFYLDRYDDIKTLSNIINVNQNETVKSYEMDINDNFTWESIVTRYLNMYKKILHV